jgi:hypothetical protein
MTELIHAYQRSNLKEFERILRSNKQTLEGDPMIKEHITDLLRNIRTAVMTKMIKPYTRIKTPFIAKELKVSVEEVEGLLVASILDGVVAGEWRYDAIPSLSLIILFSLFSLFLLSSPTDGASFEVMLAKCVLGGGIVLQLFRWCSSPFLFLLCPRSGPPK